jgi:hypothetical protein
VAPAHVPLEHDRTRTPSASHRPARRS